MIPIIEEPALRAVVTFERAVAAMRDAFAADGNGRTRVPPVINLDIPEARGEFHIKTAHIAGVPHIAVKVASGFYGNAAKGLPSGSGLMAVFDTATGFPSALLLDNGFLTDIRTGAAGAVAADYLARKGIRTVGVIGSGVQARFQVECLRTVREFSRVVAWSPTRARLEAYCDEMRAAGIDAQPAASAREVCAVADMLITATPAQQPLVSCAWLRPGIHVTAVGSDSPGKQELEPDCLLRADLVVADRLSQASAFGEISHAHGAAVHAELGEIVAGKKPGRTTDEQVTIADLTGVGFQDTAIAAAALAWIEQSSRTR
jgi:ornithine cyclodeaminase